MQRFISSCFLVSVCVFFVMSAAEAGEVRVWGSTTCEKRFLEPGGEALQKKSGISVKMMGVGTGKGLLALIEGKTTVSAASSTLESAINSARKEAAASGKTLTIPENLQFHVIANDAIVPIVHRDNPVNTLSWEQLADLSTGRSTNWKEAGGLDLPVQVVTSHTGSATKAVFQKMVMKKADYAANAIEVKSTRLEINEVSKDKGAIGAVSEGFHALNPGHTKIVKTDPIERPLALITIGPPTQEVMQIIDFFRSAEGEKYIQ
jgi:phosphate transport system substrate-binding protein